jgi:hypothetical protein
MINKSILAAIVVLLTAIASYLGYLAWDRHQHNVQEEIEHQQDVAFRAHFLGVTPQEYEAQQKADAAAVASALATQK